MPKWEVRKNTTKNRGAGEDKWNHTVFQLLTDEMGPVTWKPGRKEAGSGMELERYRDKVRRGRKRKVAGAKRHKRYGDSNYTL